MDADRHLCCGLTVSEPEMELDLRDHRYPNPVSWVPGRVGRSAEPSPVLPAGGQPVMVTIGCSVSLSAAGWRRKALLKAMLALCYAFMAYPSGTSEQRCHQPWHFVAGDTGEPSPELGVIRCALLWFEYASLI